MVGGSVTHNDISRRPRSQDCIFAVSITVYILVVRKSLNVAAVLSSSILVSETTALPISHACIELHS